MKNKKQSNIKKQYEKNNFVEEIEKAILFANTKITEKNRKEIKGIVLWTKKVLLILSIILILLFAAFVIAFGKPIYDNIKNGNIFDFKNIILGCYMISGLLFILHMFKINKEIEKIDDVSTITNIATLLLSIIALIVAILSLLNSLNP